MTDRITDIVAQIRHRVSRVPDLGIVCGSGLGGLAETLTNPTVVKYEEIRGFPRTSVQGHAGELVFGELQGKFVVCMKGRFHCYEGHDPSKLLVPIYVMAALGARALIVTNAAGGVNPDFEVTDVMMIKDQISFCGMAGFNPLVGKNDPRFGPRFPPMNGVFNADLQATLKNAAEKCNFSRPLREGVYFGVSGPSYETPHEIGMIRTMGGDSVGMSTVYEVIAAAHCGLPVLGLSLITNRCLGPNDSWEAPTHAEVLEATKKAQTEVQGLVSKFVELLSIDNFPRAKAFATFEGVKPSAAAPATDNQDNQMSMMSAGLMLAGGFVGLGLFLRSSI